MDGTSGPLNNLTSGDDARAEAAVAELAALGPDVIPALLDLLENDDADHRWWAARALSAIAYPTATLGLRRALSDPAASVRQCAALGLRTHPSPSALPELAGLLHDLDPLTARLAADALAALGQEATPFLVEALTSPRAAVRIEATRALATSQDKAAIPALFAALEDPSMLVQYWAEEALERMGLGMVYFMP